MDVSSKENAIYTNAGEKVYEHEGGLKQITNLNSDRFHAKASLEEWINTNFDSVETVVIDEPNFPRFEFNVKIQQQPKRRDVYIPGCAIARLKQLLEHQKANKIAYSPPSLIKFAFNYAESEHWLKAHQVPQHKRKKIMYREPYDDHVARLVVNGYHTAEDVLGDVADLDLIYYYLSVLRCLNCSILNQAMDEIRKRDADCGIYQSAVLPAKVGLLCTSKRTRYFTMYAETIHFLGLMSPPMCTGDSRLDIEEKVKKRNVDQTKLLCDTVGITNYAIVDRGREWFKIVRFFDANPEFCAVMGEFVIESTDDGLTVIEKQTMEQIRTLWMWRKMRDFHNCYQFAVEKRTHVHEMEAIARQCEMVEAQFDKLSLSSPAGEKLVPFLSFYMSDQKLLGITSVETYPELFYAAVSASVITKRGNSGWEHFVATRPAQMPRARIEALLAAKSSDPHNTKDDPPDEAEEKLEQESTVSAPASETNWSHDSDQDLEDGVYIQTNFNHFAEEKINDPMMKEFYVGATGWEEHGEKKSKYLHYDAGVEWDVCDPMTESTFSKCSNYDNVDLELILNEEGQKEKKPKKSDKERKIPKIPQKT